MTGVPLVLARNLTRRYGSLLAVDGVDISVSRGEVLGFLGPNGAGKSTTMQMLCGALAPDAGDIEIGGVDLLQQPLTAKRMLGYLPERPPLYRGATVDEYLLFCGRIHGLRQDALAEALAAVKQQCGLAETGTRLIGNLSRGMQQRVGIAQAIIHKPDLIVLDEPTAGLDPNQVREVRVLIKELGDQHAVILSTHILPEVQQICSRVMILHDGRLVHDSSLSAPDRCSYVVALKSPPPVDVLRALAGVAEAENIAPNRYRMTLENPNHDGTVIAEQAAAAGWGLHELVRADTDLERLFVDLTCSDQAPPP